MGFVLVFLVFLPVLIAVAVVAIKLLEFAFNRHIASTKTIARATTVIAVGAALLGAVAFFVYLLVALRGDPS